jgi:CRP/FNR family cyclic AMP-dependent transcriptional regulator
MSNLPKRTASPALNTPAPAAPVGARFDVHDLIAVTQHDLLDVFRPTLSAAQWEVFGNYLQPLSIPQGQVLIEQGANERTVYLLEAGTLTVHYEDSNKRIRLAAVDAGSAVGEGAFFSREPRTATVQAATACRLWRLTPIRFGELSNRQPDVALQVALALGAMVSRRLANRPKRIAVT